MQNAISILTYKTDGNELYFTCSHSLLSFIFEVSTGCELSSLGQRHPVVMTEQAC